MKLKLIVCGLLIALATQSYGQEHAIKVNPLAFAFKGFEISIETMVTNKTSLEFIGSLGKIDVSNSSKDIKVYGGGLRYKFYLMPGVTTFKKWYVAPEFTYAQGSARDVNNSISYEVSFFSYGVIGGYQWVFASNDKNGFLIDLNGGFANNAILTNKNINMDKVEGLQPRLSLSIGYTF